MSALRSLLARPLQPIWGWKADVLRRPQSAISGSESAVKKTCFHVAVGDIVAVTQSQPYAH